MSGKLRPDALLYKVEDLEQRGLPQVQSEIFEKTALIENYDYSEFSEFMRSMKDVDATPETIQTIYDGIAKGRIQKKLHDAYSRQGKQQIESSLNREAEIIKENISNLSKTDKVISSLRFDWMANQFGIASEQDCDQVISQLSGEERELFNRLSETYGKYVDTGDSGSFKELVESTRKELPRIERGSSRGGVSESMQQLDEVLDQYKDEVGYPGTEQDPAIPPEDSDEYHTPPPQAQGANALEKGPSRAIYEIQPGLTGYFISGRKSYFDVERKTWSKKKQTSTYSGKVSQSSYVISGALNQGIKSLPLPNSYALDTNTLTYEGVEPRILRDQNGCFYLESRGPSTFSISFGKEDFLFIGKPVPEDTSSLYKGVLSEKTEKKIKNLHGSILQKAEQVRQYILANHFYPGGGNLQSAQALQHKLRVESTGNNYLQNIDLSEYLECYSANTKFIAMLRAAKVPSRLVTGYHVEGQKDNTSKITQNSGHAWSEVWDGSRWVRFDATPQAKPEDGNNESGGEPMNPGEQADDGGQESPQDINQQQNYDESEKSNASDSSTENKKEVDNQDLEQGQHDLDQAKEQVQEMQDLKDKIEEKLKDVDSFDDLKDLRQEIENSDIFDDMKEELERKTEAKKEEMLEDIKDELDKMTDDGFMDEERREELEQLLEQEGFVDFDELQKQIEREKSLYERYESIRRDIEPLVDNWFEYFVERLPHKDEMFIDDASQTRQGLFDRRSLNRTRNLIFGTVKNPKMIKPNVKPLFLSSIMVDVSGSMSGQKLEDARKLLIFYSELFSKIEEQFGYIRFSINTFSDGIKNIKNFNQKYGSPEKYDFENGKSTTIKMRLMTEINTQGGTDMLPALRKSAQELRDESYEYPDYASALYFVGDGGDSSGNSEKIKKFMSSEDEIHGFGEHMRSAIMIGSESQRSELAQLFGDEATTVASDLDALIEKSMDKFDADISFYMENKTK
ncbi:hypothetical protein KC929_00540 [Patescibacteria group bacterium]|nr:hypothetical protein [Patescibacteria group bacterium]